MDSLEHFTCQNAISCMRLGTQQSDIGHREYSSLWSGFKLNCEITEGWLKPNKFELMPRQTVTRRYCWQFKHLCMKNVTIIPQIPQFQVQFIYFPPVTDHWPGRHARKLKVEMQVLYGRAVPVQFRRQEQNQLRVGGQIILHIKIHDAMDIYYYYVLHCTGDHQLSSPLNWCCFSRMIESYISDHCCKN